MVTATEYKQSHTALIKLCQKGDHKAFKELYHLYASAMFSISMRIINNREEAQDVLQDSFVAAFRNLRQYDGKASFGSWLKRIVINKSIDALKKNKIEMVPIETVDLMEEEKGEEKSDIYFDVPTIKKAVELLPPGYRVILTLFLFEDYSHRMIAEQLDISEGTSKSQYSRARKKLVELITQNQQP